MLIMPALISSLGAAAPVGSHVFTASLGSFGSTRNFIGVNFGPAAADRYIICTITCRDSGNSEQLTGGTIGGVPFVIHEGSRSSGSTAGAGYIFGALVPAGTSGDVLTNWNGNAGSCTCYGVACFGLDSHVKTDGFDLKTQSSTNVDKDCSVNTLGGGFVIGASVTRAAMEHIWTGLSKIVTDTGSGNNTLCYDFDLPGETPKAIAMRAAESGADLHIITASFR